MFLVGDSEYQKLPYILYQNHVSVSFSSKFWKGIVIHDYFFVQMGYIGPHGVATLHKYKYSGVDKSLVAKYILQPFWNRCVTLFPLWMP